MSRQAHHKQGHRAERVLQGHGTIVELVRGIRSKQPKLGGLKLYKLLTPRISELPAPFGRDQFYALLRRKGWCCANASAVYAPP
ncbi:MAG: hypothetical protein IPN85_18355 [Flavobacteriales bacterium]|nr:hypothetical protein [Flavobacteriales bacterium]